MCNYIFISSSRHLLVLAQHFVLKRRWHLSPSLPLTAFRLFISEKLWKCGVFWPGIHRDIDPIAEEDWSSLTCCPRHSWRTWGCHGIWARWRGWKPCHGLCRLSERFWVKFASNLIHCVQSRISKYCCFILELEHEIAWNHCPARSPRLLEYPAESHEDSTLLS